MVAIVLLPGMDGAGALFADFISALGADFEPIVVAYPPERALCYRALEEFVRAQLPIGRSFFLLGESFSGPIAISLAASKPDGLIGLVLTCTFAKNPHPYFNPFKRLIRYLPIQGIQGNLANLISPVLFGRLSTPRLRASLREALRRVSADVMRARLRAVLDVDYSAKLALLTTPTLYLRATNDRVVFPSACRHIVQVAPSVAVFSLPGPHLLLQAMPVDAANAVKEFVRQVENAEHTGTPK